MRSTTAVTVVGVKYEMLSSMGMRSELQYPAAVMVVGVRYEISDSVTVVLPGSGRRAWFTLLGDQAQPIRTIPHHWPGPSLISQKWRGLPY